MLDPAFMKYGDKSQEMVTKGVLGEVDGIKIVKVPASQLPFGVSFMIVHPSATVAPQQLKEYKTHQDPPGINGNLVEGRHLYDAFILEAKKNGIYVAMLEGTLGTPTVTLAASKPVIANKDHYVGGTWKVKTGNTVPNYGDADTGYTEIAESTTITQTSVVAYSVGGKIVAATVVTV